MQGINEAALQEPNKNKDDNTPPKKDMLDWFVDTIAIGFFPIIASMILSLCFHGYISLEKLLGDGELILSASLISTPCVISIYRIDRNKKHSKLFYMNLFAALFQILAYAAIKINYDRNFASVIITSVICVFASVMLSWKFETLIVRSEKSGS